MLMTETPCVVVNVQRCGPSTGLPTRTQQGDILTTAILSHGSEGGNQGIGFAVPVAVARGVMELLEDLASSREGHHRTKTRYRHHRPHTES